MKDVIGDVEEETKDWDDDTTDEEKPHDHKNILVQNVRRYFTDETILVMKSRSYF